MLFGYTKYFLYRISKGRVRWVEHPLETLFPEHLGRRLGGVHAELIHIECHTPEWVLGPQLRDEGGELLLVDGPGEGREQVEPVPL